ncbi:MAG: PadR family transcriptional regulator [Acidimicrobiales bacterium]
MRKTHAVVQVALALMADPGGRHWGYDLSRSGGVASGVVYPILDRMFTAGWLADDRTDPTAGREYRPPRRYYEITAGGRAALTGLLAEAGRDPRFSALISAWAGRA